LAEKRLLLVDDDALVRSSLRRHLSRQGYEILTADGGAQALALLARDPGIDAVLTDLKMPEMDGLELLQAIRARDLELPVILLTGHADPPTAAAALEQGALRFLAKPPDLVLLYEAVAHACRLRNLARAKRLAAELTRVTAALVGELEADEASFDRGQRSLRVALQPIVDVQRGEVVGREAFLRSDEPTVGGPERFLALAERLGRTRQLCRAIREAAARLATALEPGEELHLNLHASELEDEALFAEDTDLSRVAGRVVLELSDRAVLGDRVHALRSRVQRLRALSFRVALDHVGAGSAGISNLTAVEPTVAKLDCSLVADVAADARRQTIIAELLSVAGELGIDTVAVGVETEADRQVLTELGCRLQQGYLFGAPA